MDLDAIEKAVRQTAEEFAESLYSQNQINWESNRERYVNNFLEQFRGNLTKNTYPHLFVA